MRIAAAGVCRSDLHVMDGTWTYDLPMVLGHEGAGVVDAVGPGVLAPRVGDAVALAWVTACGRCRACASGSPALCEIGSHLHRMPDGSSRLQARGQDLGHFMATACFAEHVVVPATQAVELPEGTDLEVAALIGCAAMTGVGAVFNTAARAARRACRRVRLRRRRPVHRPGPARGRRAPDRGGRRDRGGARAGARLGRDGHGAGRLRGRPPRDQARHAGRRGRRLRGARAPRHDRGGLRARWPAAAAP